METAVSPYFRTIPFFGVPRSREGSYETFWVVHTHLNTKSGKAALFVAGCCGSQLRCFRRLWPSPRDVLATDGRVAQGSWNMPMTITKVTVAIRFGGPLPILRHAHVGEGSQPKAGRQGCHKGLVPAFLFENQICFPAFLRFSRKKDPWKEWQWKVLLEKGYLLMLSLAQGFP